MIKATLRLAPIALLLCGRAFGVEIRAPRAARPSEAPLGLAGPAGSGSSFELGSIDAALGAPAGPLSSIAAP
ncbi:MAG TPA: hypothetical protein VNI01_03790, partial [Elusimicrobiota bacterium]|nr:hypothetical protein [Elusimicrobiota bacterium]